MKRIETILFDLDDTLFDHLHAARTSLAALRPDLPRFASEPPETLEKEYSRLLEAVHLRVLSGEIDLNEARRERIRDLMRDGEDAPDPETVDRMAARFREGYQTNRRVVEGTEDLLKGLRDRGATLGIVTNNQVEEQRGKLAFLGLDDLVDFMVTSEEVGSPKPDPHIFHVALQRAECTPEQAVVVGDSWTSDIIGARNAGVRAVWFNPSGLPKPDPLPIAEIRSLRPTGEVIRTLLEDG